ncbi:MAG: diacylglycerol kinase family lipid kinase [Gemmatimonadota bacterium]|nr:diacylglycerol kinase family lipid kinase [Gemmatimonadota bacterium]
MTGGSEALGPSSGRTLIVLNPSAGQEDPARVRRLLGGAFAVRGASFDMAETAGAGDAERFARDGVREGYRAVAAVGGDGTVAEVIAGLAGSDTPLAIIPQGTGNQMACNLGIPRDVEGAVEVAVRGSPLPIDLGRLDDGRYFALMAGAGWDAEVMAVATRELKDRWGFGAYLYAGLRRALTPPFALFRITADDQELEVAAATVLVANVGHLVSPFFPVEFSVGPRVSFQDGLLDVCIFAPRSFSDVAAVLWRVARGRYVGDDRMIFLQAGRVRIESDTPVVTQVDGEPLGETPLSVRAVRAGVRVLVPA